MAQDSPGQRTRSSRITIVIGVLIVLLAVYLLVNEVVWPQLARTPANLTGRWSNENDGYYLIFDGISVVVTSKNCEGWPFNKKGDATLSVMERSGEFFIPSQLARQRYHVDGTGARAVLVIEDAGPIPAGTYSNYRDETFLIGTCSLQ